MEPMSFPKDVPRLFYFFIFSLLLVVHKALLMNMGFFLKRDPILNAFLFLSPPS